MSTSQKRFYVTGGTLQINAASYVARHADTDLYEGLMQGKFCYVLTSRQMGKSSLMVSTAAHLRAEGVAVAVLDLTAIGQNLTAEQWYDGLLNRMGRQLDIEDELEDFWMDNERVGPLQRWMMAVREVVLKKFKNRVVIFIDEIDAVRSLPFSTDEFFAGIREFYNRRTEDTELERVSFCLLGVATPSDLIRDTRTTPFNIGHRIELTDFNEDEAAPLAEGFGRPPKVGRELIKRILYWTGGHPYLTQRLCLAVAEDATVTDKRGVDRLCEELFLSTRARERDDNLLFVRERILRHEAERAGLLDLYARVRENKHVKDDETSHLVVTLRLSGITRIVNGYLVVSNRIYHRVFDREWIVANMPDAELRRQRAAYKRGLMRAAAVAGVILVVMAGLAGAAVVNAQRARTALEEARVERKRAEEEARRADQNARQLASTLGEREQALLEAREQRTRAEEQKSEADRQREIAARGEREAEAERARALQSQQVAEQQRSRALEAQKMAEAQRQIASNRAVEAEQQRQRAESQTKLSTSTLFNVIRYLEGAGEKQRAVEYFKQLAQVYREAGRRIDEVNTLLNIGDIYLKMKDETKAAESFNQALTILRADRNTVEEGNNLYKIGELYRAANDNERAAVYYRQSLTLLQQALQNPTARDTEALALNYLSLTHIALGDERKALEYSRRALALFEALRDSVMIDVVKFRIEDLTQSMKDKD